ncbi:PIN domain-containing protein [Novosphingopyxis sp.]|uniref:tetratricopeptide repeat protein n=1 Tax=Novosphingopyxis sp. TaxID=2709690 RepID=UPI003B598AEA
MSETETTAAHEQTLTYTNKVPMGARLASEILKPRDPYTFQRYCVVLFREELGDPNAKEYGRNGQAQGGIDILGYREGDPLRAVGVQCRKVDKPLKHATILKDCRAALALQFELREIIFATTAPDDTKADQAAKSVEQTLRVEGHDITVHVYGWGQLQTLIALHDCAYAVFVPASAATTRPMDLSTAPVPDAAAVAALVVEEMERRAISVGITLPPKPAGPEGIGSENPGLHARIDVFRDLIREGDTTSAAQRLITLRDSPEAVDAPWARYRIETNIAAALMDQGREAEAAECYVRAHAIRPDDPDAICNLSIARTIQGEPDEGMRVAQSVLDRDDRVDFAVSALLQAAVRSDWQGDPQTLIPEGMEGSPTVQLALADFMRRRWMPGWEAHVLALPGEDGKDRRDMGRLRALAVLSIAVDSRVHIVGGRGTVSDQQIDEAATIMFAYATHCLRNGYTYRHDLMAHVSNAALLLRIANRGTDAETLLREGIKSMPDEEQLRRLLAMVLIDADRGEEVLAILDPATEPETILMRIQMENGPTPAERLARVEAMNEPDDDRVASIRRRLTADLALAAGDLDVVGRVVGEMLRHPDDVVSARLLDVQRQQCAGLDKDKAKGVLLTLAMDLPDNDKPIDRFLVGQALLDIGLEADAAKLVEPHIDLQSARPATLMYLTALAEARRDGAYRQALKASSPAVRYDPAMLWLDARHAWNAGDLDRSLHSLDKFLEKKPGQPRAVLMRLEILIRLNRTRQILDALDAPIEDLGWKGEQDPYRVAGLLTHFGYHDRAARLAYRLFLEHRDKPRAWMTLSGMTIREGQDRRGNGSDWSADAVAEDIAVDVEYDDGTTAFFIVEADAHLRKLDPDSWEPEHVLVKAVWDLAVDGRFGGPDGRAGRVTKLRHKIVARFHYVLANYETRFPEVFGFKSFSINPESPNGLDEIIAQLKDRHDWVLAEQEQHFASGMPIDMLAARLGCDTIDVAGGLAEQGIRMKVAEGTEAERLASAKAIQANAKRGCVLDLNAFWSAWRLGALDDVAATCGAVSVPRSVADRLHARRERFNQSVVGGHGTLSYHEGKILHTEVTSGQMASLRDDVDAALVWIEVNDAASPIVLDDDAPAALRDHIQSGWTDMLDATILSITTDRMFVCDDLSMRSMHRSLGGTRSTWLHDVLTHSHVAGRLESERFAQQTADLIGAGQDHLGVTGMMMAIAVQMDALEHNRINGRAKALIGRLGGEIAEPLSHLHAACEALHHLWSTQSVLKIREAATGLILENLIKGRQGDWSDLLHAVERSVARIPGLRRYICGWGRGHFLPGYC